MEAMQVIKNLEKSPEFKNWRKKDKESYLSNAFVILEEGKWSIGYYSKKKNRITSFDINSSNGGISIRPYEKIFSSGEEVKELKVNEVKIGLAKAADIGESFRKECSSEGILKTIVVLQNLLVGQVWNITYFTSGFNTLNMKIDSSNGKIIEHTLTPLFKFDSGGKK